MAKEKDTEKIIITNSETLDSCFIITPIGAIDSETFKKTSGLISSVLRPVLEEFNFKAVPAYEIPNSGSINRQILKSILQDKLVIANLTSLNPNVMYELAVRHAVRLPVIILAEHGTHLPFDITDQRTIFYHDTLLGSEEAKPKLRAAITAALADSVIDNPIYQVVEEATIIKANKSDEQSINEYLIRRLDQLENLINGIRQNVGTQISASKTSIEIPKQRIVNIKFKNQKLDETQRRIIIAEIFSSLQTQYAIKNLNNEIVSIILISTNNQFNHALSALNSFEVLTVMSIE